MTRASHRPPTQAPETFDEAGAACLHDLWVLQECRFAISGEGDAHTGVGAGECREEAEMNVIKRRTPRTRSLHGRFAAASRASGVAICA